MGRVSMPQGKGSQLHNRRGYESIGRAIPDHIDQSRTHENVTLVDIPIKQAYDELFGEALAAYNAKQTRSDRKIASYYDHVKGLKTGEKLFYEDVVQWGSKDDFTDEKTRQTAKKCLIEYVNGFEERNPNIKLIGAYIHMDEASPHLHLDYIPHAHGYKRGLSVRNSFSKALHEMGFEQDPETRKDNAAVQWKKHERAVFGNICAAHGLEVEKERAARGSLSVDEYKEARDKMLEPIKQEMQPYQELEIATNEVDVKGLRLAGWVGVKDKDLKELKEQAKAYIVNRDEIDDLRDRIVGIEDKERALQQREITLDERANILVEQEQRVQAMYERQRDVNVLLERSEASVRSKDTLIDKLCLENARLKEQVNGLLEKVSQLRDAIKGAYQSLTNVVKAIGMLKYDHGKYGIRNLNAAQSKLIDGLAEYGAKWAKKDGFPEMAADIEKHVGISKGIETIIEPQAPQRKRSRSYEMEL